MAIEWFRRRGASRHPSADPPGAAAGLSAAQRKRAGAPPGGRAEDRPPLRGHPQGDRHPGGCGGRPLRRLSPAAGLQAAAPDAHRRRGAGGRPGPARRAPAGLVDAGSAVEGALAKLDRVLPDALRDRVRGTQETIGLGLSAGAGSRGRFGASVLLELGAAAHDRRRVRITYRAGNGQTTERAVDPYGVVFQSGRWYFTGWDHLRDAERTFRLDRVQVAHVTEVTFDRPVGFDPLAHVQRSIASAPGAWSVEALLDLTLQQAQSRVSPTLGTLERRPDGVLLRLTADDLNWAAHYLAG